MREFKDILIGLRKSKGMTQDRLSDALGITKQALSHYERGTRYPKKDTLDAMADYFNVDMNYLTGRSTVTSVLCDPVSSPSSDLDPDDRELLIKYHMLSDEGKGMLQDRADELIALGKTVEEEAKKDARKLG